MRDCLICDDHALVRDALHIAVQARWPGAAIAEAASFTEAWTRAHSAPELCLVDLFMPGAAPLEGVSRLVETAPETKVIVVTGAQDDDLLLKLLALGVHGFLQKTASTDIVMAALELVLSGGRYLPPRVAELAAARATMQPSAPDHGHRATERQRGVLALIAQGHSNKEIARALGLSPATVKTHVANALASVGAVNRTEAAIRAREAGLI